MLIMIYLTMTVLMGISALVKGAIYPGIAGIVGPSLCWFAASGLRGSLMVGDRAQKLGGIAATILFSILGVGIVYHSGYWIGLWGHPFSGVTWCIVGFAVGWFSTTRKMAAA
jgi:hypothetical protein